jgi:hypothetical protein
MEQDPTHPTGVRETAASSQSGTARARREKAAMATKLYVDDHKTLKFVARKCGYPTATSALRAIEGHMSAPTQLVISNPTTEMIEEMATKILSVGAKPVEEGDIFGDDADDSEILALEAKRADVVDAEIVEETA